MIAEAAGVECDMDSPFYDLGKPTGVMYRVGDPMRMMRRCYTPQVSLAEGIERALKGIGR